MTEEEELTQGPQNPVLTPLRGTVCWHLGFLIVMLVSVCTYSHFFFFIILNLMLQFDPDGYFWAVIHLSCVGKF